MAELSAWGAYGPWRERRGFDSLVQAATGIAAIEGDTAATGATRVTTEGTADGRSPGALPAQALDHGTGYLLAAAVLRALTEQLGQGEGRCVRLALARTAEWLVNGIRPGLEEGLADGANGADIAPGTWLSERGSVLGRLRYALPPVSFAGGPGDWSRPPGVWGADPARWV